MLSHFAMTQEISKLDDTSKHTSPDMDRHDRHHIIFDVKQTSNEEVDAP
jgi:hypothetical protein